MIDRARLRSCKKFWPRLLTGETPISRRVVVISDNFIKIDNLGCGRQKLSIYSQIRVNKTLSRGPFIHKLFNTDTADALVRICFDIASAKCAQESIIVERVCAICDPK